MRKMRRPTSRRGIALLFTLIMLTALALIAAQTQVSTMLSLKQAQDELRLRQCRRMLDSVPGFAQRMLQEETKDLLIDTLADDWASPKVFMIYLEGDPADSTVAPAVITVAIKDCDRGYDLKKLLEENPDQLARNIEQFVAFAKDCGLEVGVARHVAEAISEEAAVRRTEDAVSAQQSAPSDDGGAATPTAPAATSIPFAVAVAANKKYMPFWLVDFLDLPQLTDEDRLAIRAAQNVREDKTYDPPQPVTVRFLDEITAWRETTANVNTASREVLLHDVESFKDNPELVDEVLKNRATESFRNVRQLATVAGLTRNQSATLGKEMRVTSSRFLVTAEAKWKDRTARMTLVVQRKGNNKLTTLWRRVAP